MCDSIIFIVILVIIWQIIPAFLTAIKFRPGLSLSILVGWNNRMGLGHSKLKFLYADGLYSRRFGHLQFQNWYMRINYPVVLKDCESFGPRLSQPVFVFHSRCMYQSDSKFIAVYANVSIYVWFNHVYIYIDHNLTNYPCFFDSS
jgi:hypothetical protein